MNLDDLMSPGLSSGLSSHERWDICAELYYVLEAGGSQPLNLAPYAASFALFWRDVEEQVTPFQRSHGHSWRWHDEYQDPRNEAVLLLDILGYVPGDEVVSGLKGALTLADPKLRMFAAISLLRQGGVISPEVIGSIAECDETRLSFRRLLGEIQFGYLFPPELSAPEPEARAALVEWLAHPNEWECVPDEIELHGVIGGDVYVYAFRTDAGHWSSRAGRVAGISGRVVISDFQPAGSASAAEHAQRMLAISPR